MKVRLTFRMYSVPTRLDDLVLAPTASIDVSGAGNTLADGNTLAEEPWGPKVLYDTAWPPPFPAGVAVVEVFMPERRSEIVRNLSTTKY